MCFLLYLDRIRLAGVHSLEVPYYSNRVPLPGPLETLGITGLGYLQSQEKTRMHPDIQYNDEEFNISKI